MQIVNNFHFSNLEKITKNILEVTINLYLPKLMQSLIDDYNHNGIMFTKVEL